MHDATVEQIADFDRRISEFFAERLATASRYGAEYGHLWEAARRASEGGKRLRPTLVVDVHRALGGRDREVALEVAVAFELLHTAFLLHDDVIDRDEVRRGRLNLAGEFRSDALTLGIDAARAGRWGQTAAILAGDLLIHFSQSLVARLDLAPATRAALIDVFDHSVYVTAAGELADVSLGLGVSEARLADVLLMTERKTASYSFEGPLIAGAVLAGAGHETLGLLAEYGRLAGTAFQLGDDLLGVFGDESLSGKSAINDLREGKETPLIAFARSTDSWPAIAALLETDAFGPEQGAALRESLDRCGSRVFVESMIDDLASAALDLLAASDLPEPLCTRLGDFARDCVGRVA